MDTPSAFLQNPVNPDGSRQIGTKSGRYIFKPIFVALKATRHQRVGFPTRGLRTRESPQPTKPEKRHNCKEQSCRCCDANAGNPTAIGKSTTMNYLVNPKYRKDHQSQNKRGSSFQDGAWERGRWIAITIRRQYAHGSTKTGLRHLQPISPLRPMKMKEGCLRKWVATLFKERGEITTLFEYSVGDEPRQGDRLAPSLPPPITHSQ
jgi:hypothetical protein